MSYLQSIKSVGRVLNGKTWSRENEDIMGCGVLIGNGYFLVSEHTISGFGAKNVLIGLGNDNGRSKDIFIASDWFYTTDLNKTSKDILKSLSVKSKHCDFMVLKLGDILREGKLRESTEDDIKEYGFVSLKHVTYKPSVLYYIGIDSNIITVDNFTIYDSYIVVPSKYKLDDGIYFTQDGLVFAVHHASIKKIRDTVAYFPWSDSRSKLRVPLEVKFINHWLCDD